MEYNPNNNAPQADTQSESKAESATSQRKKQNTEGKSDQSTVPYEQQRRYQLYEIAKAKNIEGRSRMDKDEIIAALRKLEQ